MTHHTPQQLVQYLSTLNVSVPRYTSYPTAVDWTAMSHNEYERALDLVQKDDPVSLYVHIPFCHSMCLYCGCSVVLNRKPENEERYVQMLLQEIDLVKNTLSRPLSIMQLHFGGGTPTKLTILQLQRIIQKLKQAFIFLPSIEISIEIDPRTVHENNYEKLSSLQELGCTRISFGVQDTNELVQQAVKRRQTVEMTIGAFTKARQLGFQGINIDLIYGLPHQTRSSFQNTIETICAMSPDRIALFSYAKIPWIKPHQKAIPDALLPSSDEKFMMYMDARHQLVQQGYTAIGMDHFAHVSDPLSHRFYTRSLRRNFQGYTVLDCDTMLGFGVTAISDFPTGYFQNAKTLQSYYESIDCHRSIPTQKGKILSYDDTIRRVVIHELMCHFQIQMDMIEEKFQINFLKYFSDAIVLLAWFEERGFVQIDHIQKNIVVSTKGELFIRNIAACFDAYYQAKTKKEECYSKAI